MKKRSHILSILIIVSLLTGLLPGCGASDEETFAEIEAVLAKGEKVEKASAEIIATLAAATTVDPYQTSDDEEITVQADGDVSSTTSIKIYKDNIEELKKQAKRAKSLKKSLEDIKPHGKKAETAHDAALEYAGELAYSLRSVYDMAAFYIKKCEAEEPYAQMEYLSSSDFEDGKMGYTNASGEALGVTMGMMDDIDVPHFLEGSFDRYKNEMSFLADMLSTQKKGVELRDVWREKSAIDLNDNENVVLNIYRNQINDQMIEEYDHIQNRLGEFFPGVRRDIETLIKSSDKSLELPYKDKTKNPVFDCEITNEIYPNLYNSTDAAVNLICHTNAGKQKIHVTCEVGGFTEKYEGDFTIDSNINLLRIKPEIKDDPGDLEAGKNSQINVTVTDAKTGDVLLKETGDVRILSAYDFLYTDSNFVYGISKDMYLLNWVEPDGEGVKKVLEEAGKVLSQRSGGKADRIAAYEDILGYGDANRQRDTAEQVIAIQQAISNVGVRYNNGLFSMDASQRIYTPNTVIKNQSGICIETALLMASVLQKAGFHAMVLMTPGHARTLVESSKDSGQYFLIETTLLPFDTDEWHLGKLLTDYGDRSGWLEFIQTEKNKVTDSSGNGIGMVKAIDCDFIDFMGNSGIGY